LSIKDHLYGPTSVNFNYCFAAVRVVLCRTIKTNYSFYTILYIFNSVVCVFHCCTAIHSLAYISLQSCLQEEF